MVGVPGGNASSLQQTALLDAAHDIPNTQESLYGDYDIGYKKAQHVGWVTQPSPAPLPSDMRDIHLSQA